MHSAITDILRSRVTALTIRSETLRAAQEIAAAAGLPGNDAADRLRREWLNDLVSDRDSQERDRASARPDDHFLDWVRVRAHKPFHITYRAVAKVARTHDSELAMRLANISWHQEIAWAQRLRGDGNPRVAVLSALFLREAASDPGKVFVKIADAWEGALSDDPGYHASTNHELTSDEIRAGIGDPLWTPLCLRYAGRAFADVLNTMPRHRLEALAARAQRDEGKEQARIAVQDTVRRLRRKPLSHLLGVISVAVDVGLGSNDLLDLERRFLADIECGTVDIKATGVPIYRLLNDFVRRNSGDLAPQVTGEEAIRRRMRVDSLGRRWTEQLPPDFQPLRACSKECFEIWKADVLDGVRAPPADPVVDYGFYLTSASRDGVAA